MFLVYYDESGDDGIIKYSAPLFVLTGIYINKDNWKEAYQEIYSFRKNLRTKYGLLLKTEGIARPISFSKVSWDLMRMKALLSVDLLEY